MQNDENSNQLHSHPRLHLPMKTQIQKSDDSSQGIRPSSFGLRHWLVLLPLVVASLAPAQTVPPFINYQGKVADSAGVGLGTPTPLNRKVLFRIYDAAAAGTLLYTEEQTVTLSGGEFSVLIGQGIAFQSEPKPALDTVFTSAGTNRYLEITVDNGDSTINASDAAITPRQQITSTAYAFRARSAETVASGTDLTLQGSANYGLGWYGAGRPFGGTAIDGPVLYGTSGGALGSYNGTTQTPVLRWNAAGQVGIGSASLAGAAASTKLVLQGDDTGAPPLQLNIRGSTDTNKRLLIGYNTTGNYGALQAYNGASTPTSLMINAAGGNVGIGTGSLAPASMLSVGGQIRIDANGLNDGTNNHNLVFGNVGSGEYIGRRATPGGNQFGLDFFTGNTSRITITNSGNVGIGTQAPGALLEVSGSQGNFRVHPGFPPSNNTIYAASLNSASTAGAQFRFQRTGDFIDIGQNGAGSFVIENSSDTAIMTLTQAAAVGIGVTNPASNTKFQVRDSRTAVGNGGQWLSLSAFSGPNHAVVMGEFDSNGTTAGGQVAVIGGHNAALNMWTSLAINPGGGNVGIGDTNPTRAKLVIEGVGSEENFLGNHTLYGQNLVHGQYPSLSESISLYCSGAVHAGWYRTNSDARIKIVKGISNGADDLKALLGLKITDYVMKDAIENGNRPQKKVIAQQAEEVYPHAVSRMTNVVPDIY